MKLSRKISLRLLSIICAGGIFSTASAYSDSIIYLGGDTTEYNGNTYKAGWWTKGDAPGTNHVWTLVSESTDTTPTPKPTPTPDTTDYNLHTDLQNIAPLATFLKIFPHADSVACTSKKDGMHGVYAGLIEAAKEFPEFANPDALPDMIGGFTLTEQDKVSIAKREVAAFLANASQETTGGWATAPDGPSAWGLCFTEEVGCESGQCTEYTSKHDPATFPFSTTETYHGRGMIQLSWNYNYKLFQDYYNENFANGNPIDLINNPGLVIQDHKIAWLSALWFWMTPQSPKPSAHDAMTGIWQPSDTDKNDGRLPGLVMTINIINGGLECSKPTIPKVEGRVSFMKRYSEILGTTTGDNLYCNNMKHY